MDALAEYDPRYLAGIVLFNRHQFFSAHEIWEDLWQDCRAELRRFYQGLIQAAVALHHWNNGNWRGAKRLFQSGRNYMKDYPDVFLGLEIDRFWQQMKLAVAEALGDDPPASSAHLDPKLVPEIAINPPPSSWPDPDSLIFEE
jgi:uncharacterized protein